MKPFKFDPQAEFLLNQTTSMAQIEHKVFEDIQLRLEEEAVVKDVWVHN